MPLSQIYVSLFNRSTSLNNHSPSSIPVANNPTNLSVCPSIHPTGPRRIFVNIGLLDVVKPTDDELGLILGHELSHLILKHSHSHNQLSAFLASFQLILLVFVDPTGMLSLFADILASGVMKYIDNAYSRHDEEEADDLGTNSSQTLLSNPNLTLNST